MKQVNIKLSEAADAFNSLNNMLVRNEFPFETAWELEDILEVLEKPTKRFEKEREKLLAEHATPNGKMSEDGSRSFKINNKKEFEEGMKALIDVSVKIKFTPISYEKLKSVPNLTVNPHDLSVLKKHFIEKVNGETKETNEDKKK